MEEKARDAKVVLEVAVRGKKALAERVAAAKTVGTRRERASISHTDGRTLVPGWRWVARGVEQWICAGEVAVLTIFLPLVVH